MKAVEGLLDTLLPIPRIEGLDLRLKRVQIDAWCGRQILLAECDDVSEAGACGGEYVRIQVERRLLGNIGDPHLLLNLQCAVVGLLQSAQNLEERRFACAVSPDQANAFGLYEREVCVIQQRDVAECQLRVEKGDECHVPRIIGSGRMLTLKTLRWRQEMAYTLWLD